MELSDEDLITNRDWDPCYLNEVLSGDFFEFNELWTEDLVLVIVNW